MKPRTKRSLMVLGGLASLGLASALVLDAFRSNLVFYFSPSEVAASAVPSGQRFRLGGVVEEGSLRREGQTLRVSFGVTDGARTVPVHYEGLLPDMFREGKGVVAQGVMDTGGVFVADQVLAKHDENYMPPEAAQALEDARLAANTEVSTAWTGGGGGTP
ncbi:cytochrome c maturation protein CcmE [Castellaniella sp. S9]|uniref:cytochrome c maturation protein CcmE n=1 Tax=Castellaniella sp. S9 TaxID=2993652 RepID=UPI0022B347E5|nr:cytochrome c maturation protein CcmE [Castellaniella sp. S9]